VGGAAGREKTSTEHPAGDDGMNKATRAAIARAFEADRGGGGAKVAHGKAARARARAGAGAGG
jgi:hypothetical protein